MSASKQWQTAKVDKIEDVADRIRRIELLPERPVKVRAGEHIDVQLPLAGGADHRSYSLVEGNEDGSRIVISVLHTRDSRGGSEFMHQLQEGDTLRITRPIQDFPLRVGARQYVLLAGGIGITPILGMARVLKRIGADYRVVYVGRKREAMAYLDLMEEEHGDRLETHVDAEGSDLDVAGLVEGIQAGTELYMCGPIRLMDAVRRAWKTSDLGVTNLRFETFGNSGWFDPEPFTVAIPSMGIETTVGTGESMLEALEAAGADMMFDCRKGECGLCMVQVLSMTGKTDHRDVFLSESQHAEAPAPQLISCVSRVAADGEAPACITIEAH